MKFPWDKYIEIPVGVRNTLQVFITNRCNLRCPGCFARKCMAAGGDKDISTIEYSVAVMAGLDRGVQQINIIGGEPLLHPFLLPMIRLNSAVGLKTTIYTNGYRLNRFGQGDLHPAKIRASVYHAHGPDKSLDTLTARWPVDICFMVSAATKVEELVEVACNTMCASLFISSIRELDNPRQEFFDDTGYTMPVLEYKELVHEFLRMYNGPKDIHVSKRGVFESAISPGRCTCRFANYFIGGKVIQCPYDIVNEKYQEDYAFGKRPCQQNSTCLMSKVVYRPRRKDG